MTQLKDVIDGHLERTPSLDVLVGNEMFCGVLVLNCQPCSTSAGRLAQR